MGAISADQITGLAAAVPMARASADGRMSRLHYARLAGLPATFFSGNYSDLAGVPAFALQSALAAETARATAAEATKATVAQAAAAAPVQSVAGRTGAVVLTTDDVAGAATAAQVGVLSARLARFVGPLTLSVAVPALAVLATTTLSLAVPGALAGGAVTLNWSDAAMAGNVAGVSVTAPGVVSVTLKAVAALTAGTRAFTVAVANP